MLPRRALLAVLVVAQGLIPAAAAQAAPTWLSPVDIEAAPKQASSLRVALDAEGDAVAVWKHCDSGTCTVQAATRPAGNSPGWRPPQALSSGRAVGDLQLALDAEGGAVAAWEEGQDGAGAWTVMAVTRPAGGGWGQPESISAPGASAGGFRMAVGPEGHAMTIWRGSAQAACDPLQDGLLEQLPDEWTWAPQPCENGTTGVQAVQAATRSTEGGWSAPEDVASADRYTSLRGLQLGLDAEGDAVAVWNRYSGTFSIVQAADYDAGRDKWSAPQDISPATELQYAEAQQLAVDAQGNAAVVWHTEYWYDRNATVFGTTRAAGGSWGVPEFVSLPYQHARNPQVGIDSQRNAVAVWHGGGRSSSSSMIQAAIRPPGGTWSAWRDLSATGRSSDPQLTVDPRGTALWATWTRNIGGNDIVEVARRAAGASSDLWSATQSISAAGQNAAGAQIGVDPDGNAVAGWSRYDGSQHVLQAAGYDAAGPRLRNLRLPEEAGAGAPLSFLVFPLDVWSGIAWTRWDFGDGASALGAAVSHRYAAPGSYDVTVTSTDALGNSSSAKRTLRVAPAASAGAGNRGGATQAGASRPDPRLGGGEPAGALVTEHLRAGGLRRCLSGQESGAPGRAGGGSTRAQARRRQTRRRRSARRRCLARHGRKPGRVSGLSARARSKTQIALSFRAPASDGNGPPAARSYLVKQSLRPIRGRRFFRRAQPLCGGACRFSVTRIGTRITLTVTGLRPRTSYWYAVAARDNVSGRLGPRSKVVRARTR